MGFQATLQGSNFDSGAVTLASVASGSVTMNITMSGTGDEIDPTDGDDVVRFVGSTGLSGNLNWTISCPSGIDTARCPVR